MLAVAADPSSEAYSLSENQAALLKKIMGAIGFQDFTVLEVKEAKYLPGFLNSLRPGWPADFVCLFGGGTGGSGGAKEAQNSLELGKSWPKEARLGEADAAAKPAAPGAARREASPPNAPPPRKSSGPPAPPPAPAGRPLSPRSNAPRITPGKESFFFPSGPPLGELEGDSREVLGRKKQLWQRLQAWRKQAGF